MLYFGVIDFNSINRISKSLHRISKNILILVVQSFSFFDFIYSRDSFYKCKCVDGNASDVKLDYDDQYASDVKFDSDDQYWCCKTPNTTCTNGRWGGRICQGKKLPLSKQCHDDTKITVYPGNGSFIRITHPRCNHYPTSPLFHLLVDLGKIYAYALSFCTHAFT